MGITLGVNNCTFSNYSLTGKYAIQSRAMESYKPPEP